jgi:hypothetical protein
VAGGDAEHGAEGGVPGAAAIESEDELVEVGLELLAAQAVIDAQGPDPRLRGGRLLRLAKMRCTQACPWREQGAARCGPPSCR